jgi:hypothetical protein
MKTFLILAGVGLFCLLLIITLFFSEFNIQEKEREWFVRNLRYEFSVTVDSVQQHYRTFADARVTAGEPRFYREDSLKNSLEKHERLILVTDYQNDSIRFTLEEFAGEIRKGDSIRFSSKENSITGYRAGKQIFTAQLSELLSGWGKSPFER